MKKSIFLSSLLIAFSSLFAEGFQIKNVYYDIEGCGPRMFSVTKEYALEQNVPVDTDKTFSTLEEVEAYIKDYKTRLNNTRAFETTEVSYTIEGNEVTLNVKVKDSFHMVVIPYGRYDSNKGLIFKFKIKDSNFLGTLNPLTTDVNFLIEQNNPGDPAKYKFGFNFDYDYPFKAGIFNATWKNDHEINYTIGDPAPEWNLKTGLNFSLPYDRFSLDFDIIQGFANNFDYSYSNDAMYFTEEAKFSVPVTLKDLGNKGKITYTPYLDFVLNWDFDSININNSTLSSPNIILGHKLNGGRANWKNNFREGFTATISNDFKYNIQRNMLYPIITADLKGYKSFRFFEKDVFNQIGFTGNLYTVAYLMDYNKNPYIKNDGVSIGAKLRGIRDEQKYTIDPKTNLCSVPAALVLNLDMPFRIVKTNFTNKFLKYLNFDMQVSPFVDMALTYNKATKQLFDPKDGLYAAGVEVLVFPQKLSSFTIRGSLGIDVGRKLFGNYLNMDWRPNVSVYEIFFGVGLQY